MKRASRGAGSSHTWPRLAVCTAAVTLRTPILNNRSWTTFYCCVLLGQMRGAGGRATGAAAGEDNAAYKAQLAEVLGRWEAERATTADLQGRAAAAAAATAAGLEDRALSSAEAAAAAALAQAELESVREKLEAERRGRADAEREADALRLQVAHEMGMIRWLVCGLVLGGGEVVGFVGVHREWKGRCCWIATTCC